MVRNFFKDNFQKVVDVKTPPKKAIEEKEFVSKFSSSGARNRPHQRHVSNSFRRTAIAFFVVVVIVGAFFVYSAYSFHNKLIESLKSDVGNFEEAASKFNPLASTSSISGDNVFSGQNFDFQAPLTYFGTKVVPLLKNSVDAYKMFQGVTFNTLVLFGKASSLAQDAPKLVFGQKGSELISRLDGINFLLKEVSKKASSFTSTTAQFENFRESDVDFYLPLQLELGRIHDFLSSLLVWLKSENTHHVLVLFGNPSEMRPGGGFVGSFADFSILGGNLSGISIHDINDSDKELETKTIPPKPVQVIAANFRAADANFFFDFPSSASKVLKFVEGSNLYKQASTTFDGVVAISPKIISDLLKLTGPIEIKEEKVTIDSENFLTEIQKQVQTNRAQGASYPKRILQKITPLLFEKLSGLSDVQTRELLSIAPEWISKKEIVFFFKDPEFQNFLGSYNATGHVFEFPQGFYGDYLAVVNANLGGGKTDIFVDQNIFLQSQINDDGTVSDNLSITRKHNGDKAKDWWYKVANQNYLQVFTPQGSRLQAQNGGFDKVITPKVNYKKEGYEADPLVTKIESTEKSIFGFSNVKAHEEFGKNVFTTWSKIQPGKKEELTFNYINRLPLPPLPGRVYEFVFERQAGSKGTYKFEIGAPIGFRWRENQLPIFEYENSNPPARLILKLTMEKAPD